MLFANWSLLFKLSVNHIMLAFSYRKWVIQHFTLQFGKKVNNKWLKRQNWKLTFSYTIYIANKYVQGEIFHIILTSKSIIKLKD